MKKFSLFFLFFIYFFYSNAQNTMYFMEQMPQKQNLNPALMPKVGFYLNLPGLNGFSANAYNSGFNYNELKGFLDHLDEEGYNPDKFVQSIGKINRFQSEGRVGLFGFGFRIKDKTFFSFSIDLNSTLILDAESDIAYLLTDYDDIREIKFPIVIDGVDLNTNNYMNIGFNYIRKLNEHLTIGINPNLNSHLAGIKAKDLKYVVEIESKDHYGVKEYNETFTGEAVLGLPVEINSEAITDGKLDLDEGLLSENWDEDLELSDMFTNTNFSINLGAVYQLNQWNLSASLLNIGAGSWKRNAYRLEGTEDDILISTEKIKIGIPPKIYLGAARQFSPRWNYGLMIGNTFFPGKSLASATLSLNGAVGRMLSTSFSYTAGYKFDNFGLGFRLRFFPGMDVFFVTDNLVQATSYKKSYRMSGSVGINISTGLKNYLNTPKGKLKESI